MSKSAGRGRKIGAVTAIVIGILAALGYFNYRPGTDAKVPVIAPPAPSAPAAPVAADCLRPGPVPVLPRGASATAEDMKTQHDALQGFVVGLEAYQTCLEQKIANAPPDTDAAQKEFWRQKGNDAIDEAHALAAAFAEQLQIYKARQP
jgi:hypothetical protein